MAAAAVLCRVQTCNKPTIDGPLQSLKLCDVLSGINGSIHSLNLPVVLLWIDGPVHSLKLHGVLSGITGSAHSLKLHDVLSGITGSTHSLKLHDVLSWIICPIRSEYARSATIQGLVDQYTLQICPMSCRGKSMFIFASKWLASRKI